MLLHSFICDLGLLAIGRESFIGMQKNSWTNRENNDYWDWYIWALNQEVLDIAMSGGREESKGKRALQKHGNVLLTLSHPSCFHKHPLLPPSGSGVLERVVSQYDLK